MVDDSSGATAAGPPLHPEWRADQTADLTARMPTVQARPAPHEQIEGQPTVQLPVIKAPSVSAARIETDRPVILPSERRPPRRGFRARYAVVYDVNGPWVRLGIGWAILVAASLVYRPARPGALAVLYAAAAGWAAFQAVTAWRPGHNGVDRWVAAAGAAALPVATAAFGARGTGATLVGFVAVALAAGFVEGHHWRPAVMIAGRAVTCGAWVGLVGAALVLTLRYEIGAVITLLVLVAVYEASDYIVGSGASNRIEGPLAGIISIAAVTSLVALLRVPPFEGLDAFAFGALAAILCPVGQLVGSAVLPSASAHAPALRRLDSLLVLAPVWAWLIGLLLIHQA